MLYTANRRTFLASVAAGGSVLIGCQPAAEPEAVPVAVRRDVPLRIVLCGNARWGEALQTAWSAIAEQPLQLQVIEDTDIETWDARVLEALKRSDVGLVPAGVLAALESNAATTAPQGTFLGPEGIDLETLYPVVREGLIKYAGKTAAAPLGAIQPVLVMKGQAEEQFDAPKTMAEYLELARSLPAGTVAEPLAGGAAAKMFLWRANLSNPPAWLFDRNTFAPVIATPAYVAVLEEMKRCADVYGAERLTPGEVWSRVATGKLRLAIAWPAVHSEVERIEEAAECTFASLPITADASSQTSQPLRALLDADSPVAVVSAHCRQSEAARRFVAWAISGEGTDLIQAVVTGLTPVRSSGTSSSDAASSTPVTSTYAAQLAKSLSTLSLRPSLQLLQYKRYAQALDDAVRSHLDGKQTALEALTAAASAWAALTEQIGVKEQQRAWQRAQGLSG